MLGFVPQPNLHGYGVFGPVFSVPSVANKINTDMDKRSQLLAPPIGWPLLPGLVDGSLNYPDLEQSVRQSIKIILLTRQGEQLMRPNFGDGLNQFLHEPNTLITRRRIRDAVQTSLLRWEPRIQLQRVDVWEVEDKPDTLRVEIVYQIKRTGVMKSMTLSLSLEG